MQRRTGCGRNRRRGTSLCIVAPFVLEMLALHHLTAPLFTLLLAIMLRRRQAEASAEVEAAG